MRRRPPHLVELADQDRLHLENLVRDGRTQQRVARRARLLLAMADSATVVQELAGQWDLARNSIWYLCRRYEELGVDAVFDAPRAGRPCEISPLATSSH